MFEKYNEKARRALFFARYEASKLGSKVIESEHLLLGILREGEDIIKEIFARFNVKPEDVRREIEGDRIFVERISSTAELPLSEESKKILAYASHEAESMMHPYVGTEHLLIGLLRVDGCVAGRLLTARGFNLYGVREETISLIKEREVSQAEEGAPVPGRVQPRPDAARRHGDFRPAHRPRQGGRANHPDPFAPDEEQPDPARRTGRRQDRDRRGAGDAHRRGRGPDLPLVEEDPRARPLAHRRRDEVPRPVRGASQGHHPGAPREPGPHHLHRRDPFADRSGVGRGLARRREHPEARPFARRGVVHRRDDAEGVPQVHREGPQPSPPVPGDQRHRAAPRTRRSRSSRASRIGTSSSTRSATRPRRSRRPSISPTGTSPTVSSPTRRSTSSTRPAPR